jgi:hypothetical protein
MKAQVGCFDNQNERGTEMGAQISQGEANKLVVEEVDEESIFQRLKKLHGIAAIFMGVQAIAYGAVCGSSSASTIPTVGFQGEDNADYCDGLACDINVRGLGKADSLFLMPLFVALAAFDHIVCYLYATYYAESAKHWIFNIKSNPFRWIEYSVSASTMALALTILCRITGES